MTIKEPKSEPFDRHIGRRVAQRRKHLRLSQDDLARRLGVSIRGMRGLEKGGARVTACTLNELGVALGVPMTFFVEGLPATARPDRTRRGTGVVNGDSGPKLELEARTVAHDLGRIADPRARRKVREMVTALADAINAGGERGGGPRMPG